MIDSMIERDIPFEQYTKSTGGRAKYPWDDLDVRDGLLFGTRREATNALASARRWALKFPTEDRPRFKRIEREQDYVVVRVE